MYLAEEAEGWIGGHYVGFLKLSLTPSERKSPSPKRDVPELPSAWQIRTLNPENRLVSKGVFWYFGYPYRLVGTCYSLEWIFPSCDWEPAMQVDVSPASPKFFEMKQKTKKADSKGRRSCKVWSFP